MPVINGIYLKDFTALPGAVADANIIPIAITGDQVAYRTTVAGIITDARVTSKLLTGLSVTGGAIASTDSILTAFGKVQNQVNDRVPYTGATANVDLGTFDLTTDIVNLNQLKAVGSGGLNIYSNSGTHIALLGGGGGAGTTFYGGIIGTSASFSSSGSSDTVGITHSSGSGIALNITKGGNGEGLYINKTSGSGNAATIIGTLNATTLVKSGGTSSQFLKADGSVDSNTYALASALSDYVTLTTAQTISGAKTFTGLNKSDNEFLLKNSVGSPGAAAGYTSIRGFSVSATTKGISFVDPTLNGASLLFDNTAGYVYTFPNATGTVALTSNITSAISGTTNYVPKFTSANIIGNSNIQDDGTTIKLKGTTDGNLWVRAGSSANAGGTGVGLSGLNDAGSALVNLNLQGDNICFISGGSNERMRINSFGNLGLGVTPSAWATSNLIALELANGTSFWRQGSSPNTWLSTNVYFNGNNFIYTETAQSSAYNQSGGSHIWYNAPSGTAGNVITFTQAMTLGSNSGLSIGTTTSAATNGLLVAGAATFSNNITSNYSGANFRGISAAGVSQNAYALFQGTNASSVVQQGYVGINPFGSDGSLELVNSSGAGLKISQTAGAAIFSSNVTVVGLLIGNDRLYMPGNQPISNWISASLTAGYSSTNGYGWINGAGNLILGTDGIERMRITSGGNVGIGTTSPTSKLQVVGLSEYATNALAITGGLTVGAFYHTAGVLKVVI